MFIAGAADDMALRRSAMFVKRCPVYKHLGSYRSLNARPTPSNVRHLPDTLGGRDQSGRKKI